MPGANVFVDSNVLLYGRDRELTAKAERTGLWLQQTVMLNAAVVNLQVLNEVTGVMLRKRDDLTASEIFASVDELAFLGRTPVRLSTVMRARSLRAKTAYSWWDCLLLASALELGCTHFLSEDLQDGHRIEDADKTLTIVDPFAHTPDQILLSR
jgi:predicted nucleic acid-binding protein